MKREERERGRDGERWRGKGVGRGRIKGWLGVTIFCTYSM